MTADYHLHSCFSGDSETPTEEVVRSGLEKGLSLLCLTEHFDPDYPYADVCMDLDAPAYFAEARRLQALYESRIEIRVGAELGLQPRLGTFLDSWLERNMAECLSFDFLIGSTHLVDGTDPYYPEFWNGREPEASVGRFLDITLENVRAFDCFDVYGHLDYIVRYIPDGERRFSYSSHRDQVDAILKLLIEKGKGIEINTGGWKAGLSEPNPCGEVLRRHRELGGEIITTGSDAHTPEYTGFRLEDAKEVLRSCGFRYFTIFRERKPEFIKL